MSSTNSKNKKERDESAPHPVSFVSAQTNVSSKEV